MNLPWLDPGDPFPDAAQAWDASQPAPGLLAAGGALDVDSLHRAYRHGIFPWFSEGQPILWWSTDPRMVLFTDRFVIAASLKKTLRKVHKSMHSDGRWQVRFDSAFEAVIMACAAPRADGTGTWI